MSIGCGTAAIHACQNAQAKPEPIPFPTRMPVKPVALLPGRPIQRQSGPPAMAFRLVSTESFRRAFSLSIVPRIRSGNRPPLVDGRPGPDDCFCVFGNARSAGETERAFGELSFG